LSCFVEIICTKATLCHKTFNRSWHSCNWWAYFHWKCSDHNFGGWGLKLGD